MVKSILKGFSKTKSKQDARGKALREMELKGDSIKGVILRAKRKQDKDLMEAIRILTQAFIYILQGGDKERSN